MRLALLLSCLWPGLAHLWWRGERFGIVAAFAFSAWLNLALAAKFIWPELLPPLGNSLVWGLLSLVWVAGVCHSVASLRRLADDGQQDTRANELFVRAQSEYLKGHWFECEALLHDLLRRRPRDLEAQLLLASLFRHTRRIVEAREQLKAVGRLEGAGRWRVEIFRETQLLDRVSEESAESAQFDTDLNESNQQTTNTTTDRRNSRAA